MINGTGIAGDRRTTFEAQAATSPTNSNPVSAWSVLDLKLAFPAMSHGPESLNYQSLYVQQSSAVSSEKHYKPTSSVAELTDQFDPLHHVASLRAHQPF